MHLSTASTMAVLTAIVLVPSSFALAVPTRTHLLSSLKRVAQLVAHRSTPQLPYPDHYGPKSCHDATKSHGNPWSGGLSPVPSDSLSLSSMSSLPTTLLNTSSLSLTSRIPKPSYPCYLVALRSFVVTGRTSATTPQIRLQAHLKYVFAFECNSVVYRVLAWLRESPREQIAVADVHPNDYSGLIALTALNAPRDVQLELVFVINGTHEGTLGLYQVLEYD